MIRALSVIAFVIVTSGASASDYNCDHYTRQALPCDCKTGECMGGGHYQGATATIKMTREPRCTGWTDAAGECRHGIGGSGMGTHGYVGPNGGRGQ